MYEIPDCRTWRGLSTSNSIIWDSSWLGLGSSSTSTTGPTHVLNRRVTQQLKLVGEHKFNSIHLTLLSLVDLKYERRPNKSKSILVGEETTICRGLNIGPS